MAQSLSKIYVHTVFSTKHRLALLNDTVRPSLFKYTATVLNHLDCTAIEVGGVADHLHILCVLSKNISAAKLIEEVKKPTSKWLKTQDPALHEFHWQAGYAAFSVSPSNVGRVREYIVKQPQHHESRTFEEEFRQLLRAHGVEWDERYVWD